MNHFNVSLTVWAKSQDRVHKPQFLKRKESRSGSNRGASAYQPSALPLGHTGSHSGDAKAPALARMTSLSARSWQQALISAQRSGPPEISRIEWKSPTTSCPSGLICKPPRQEAKRAHSEGAVLRTQRRCWNERRPLPVLLTAYFAWINKSRIVLRLSFKELFV